MKRFFIAVAIAATTLTLPASATDVGVSVTVGQPGFYGQIEIGDFPQPRVIYAQPRIIEQRVSIQREPIYLHVPPSHAKNWKKYCHKYRACGEPVFFVKNDWYEHEYAPRYQEKHRDRDNGHGHQKNHDKGHGNNR